MNYPPATASVILGLLQLSILLASALVPFQLHWKEQLRQLPRLLQQLFRIHGGYVVLSIVSLAMICIAAAEELSTGSRLARCFCICGAAFWGIRLGLQAIIDAKPHLTNIWLRIGNHALTIVYAAVTLIFLAAVLLQYLRQTVESRSAGPRIAPAERAIIRGERRHARNR